MVPTATRKGVCIELNSYRHTGEVEVYDEVHTKGDRVYFAYDAPPYWWSVFSLLGDKKVSILAHHHSDVID